MDQETANARGAHLGEGDFFLAGEGGHAAMKARSDGGVESPIDWTWSAAGSLPIADVHRLGGESPFLGGVAYSPASRLARFARSSASAVTSFSRRSSRSSVDRLASSVVSA